MKNRDVFYLVAVVIFITVSLMKNIYMPKVIDSRCKDLNLMRYDGELNKFVLKDSVEFDKWDLQYIKHGTMKR